MLPSLQPFAVHARRKGNAGLRRLRRLLNRAIPLPRKRRSNLRAIKNWYEARHAPSSSHLLTLARSSPGILKLVLEQVGGDDLFDAFQLLGGRNVAREIRPQHVPINVPIKPSQLDLNGRQSWFLDELRRRAEIRSIDIVSHFGVSLKTAKRDIASLKKLCLINYIGAKKKGHYIAIG